MVQLSRMSQITVFAVIFIGALFALPNLTGKTDVPGLPQNQLTLGLDLQGGAYLVLEVETATAGQDYLNSVRQFLRRQLADENIRTARPRLENGTLTFRIMREEDFANAVRIARQGAGSATVTPDDAARTITFTMSEEAESARVETLVAKTVEVIRRRVDGFGLTEPSIQRQGDKRIVLQLPGVRDVESIKTGMLKTARLEFRAVGSENDFNSEEVPYNLAANPFSEGQTLWLDVDPVVTGESLEAANAGVDQDGLPAVDFRFEGAAAKLFGDFTSQNVGQPFAIVLDNEVISAPVIRSPILYGSGQISGGFSATEARDLSKLLQAGALPAPINFLEERSVGASLGEDSIKAGFIACIIGLLAVLIFMGVYYGLFGMIANLGLAVNLVLLLGMLSMLGATLTLPGIAGIVLTVGMAVDANVLIFERMREAYANSAKSLGKALEKGYSEALSSILDANLTTLLGAIVLFMFGTGPVQGFAVTLSIGIITSMFTALFFTRILVGYWWSPKRTTLPIA